MSTGPKPNPLENRVLKDLPGFDSKKVYSLSALQDPRVDQLPYSIRILLESAVRNCDDFSVKEADVETILNWKQTSMEQKEIPFKPARVILQDFTGVPAVADLAGMRDAMTRLGGKASDINPLVPVDLVIDHSVQADFSRTPEALKQNEDMEMYRNRERFEFLKWGARAFDNMLIVPPGSGIVHQVNLEYLARVVMESKEGVLYPDSVVGTDSHTTMIDGLGVAGWGVGGIEAEAVMLGQAISMVLPEVVGVNLTGAMPSHATATDLVLTLTQMLRKHGVVGKFVEFYGPGSRSLSLADRATIANMAPEYGATMGFFPVDEKALTYLRQTGRSEERVRLVEAYCRENALFASADRPEPTFSTSLHLDLGEIVPCVSGPKRPHDRVPASEVKKDFEACLSAPVGFKGYDLPPESLSQKSEFTYKGQSYSLEHGSVVIAAITSCTNTSNPGVIVGAALLAKNAYELGLSIPPYIKTTLSPGSKAVSEYLKLSGLDKEFEKAGFFHAGYGCMTCIGNSGELDPEVAEAINSKDLVACAVLSGNRNFEGRTHPLTRANYLASPPLVVAYALAGKMNIDFETEPLGVSPKTGNPVFLKDIWPSNEEIAAIEESCVKPEMFNRIYSSITDGTEAWQNLKVPEGKQYSWSEESTYIHNPPFFQSTQAEPAPVQDIKDAYCLLNLGDSITTDHISPAGNIAAESPAAKFLNGMGVEKKDFNTYGARRGNDLVMARGTFANIRLVNKMAPKGAGPKAMHVPSKELAPVFDVAQRYMQEGVPSIIVAGKEYGSGSSRDWAAKGPYLQGVRCVIAESFERIHRSNLVGMGILPLQFPAGVNGDSIGLDGHERFTIDGLNGGAVTPGQTISVKAVGADGKEKTFETLCRIDTDVEVNYFQHGGILQFVLRKRLAETK